MHDIPEKETGENDLPIPPYAVYTIGGGTPEKPSNLHLYPPGRICKSKSLPEGYDFKPTIDTQEGLREFTQ